MSLIVFRPSHVAAAALLAACGAASAQRAALVQDADEPARMPYQQKIDCFDPSSNVCRFTFQKVPAGRRREIRLVSCSAQGRNVSLAIRFQGVQLWSTATGVYLSLPIPVQNAPIYNGFAYGQTSMYFEAGDTPFIQMLAVDILEGGTCTVVGRDITL